jgi:hypothetical protein
MTNKFQISTIQKIKPGYLVFLIWFLEFGYYLFFDA